MEDVAWAWANACTNHKGVLYVVVDACFSGRYSTMQP